MTARDDATGRSDVAFADAAATLAATAGALLEQGRAGEADAKDIATVLAAAARLYSARVERDGAASPPVERDALTATETVPGRAKPSRVTFRSAASPTCNPVAGWWSRSAASALACTV
jgi:hypothetical protein